MPEIEPFHPLRAMLRIALACAFISLGASLRLDSGPQPEGEELHPPNEKKITGPENPRCKINKRSRTQVIGGTIVDDPAEFPFLAWIGDRDGTMNSQFCGGTLISERIVLTAAHCLYNSDKRNAYIWVRLGVANFAQSLGIARNVVNWRRHPDYNKVNLHNDLGLMLLNESVAEELVQPMRLSDGSTAWELEGRKTVVGWGSTDEHCAIYDTQLRKAEVPMGTRGVRCHSGGSKTIGPKLDYDHASQCCAGEYAREKHYPGCGDSGGPLLHRDNQTWYQVGMVSWSYGAPWPDVFTRVSYFQSWINATQHELLEAGEHPAVAKIAPAAQAAPTAEEDHDHQAKADPTATAAPVADASPEAQAAPTATAAPMAEVAPTAPAATAAPTADAAPEATAAPTATAAPVAEVAPVAGQSP